MDKLLENIQSKYLPNASTSENAQSATSQTNGSGGDALLSDIRSRYGVTNNTFVPGTAKSEVVVPEKEKPTAGNRLGNVVSGAGKSYGSSVVSAAGVTSDVLSTAQKRVDEARKTEELARYQRNLDNLTADLASAKTDKEREKIEKRIQQTQNYIDQWNSFESGFSKDTEVAAGKLNKTADTLAASAQEDIDEAKEGLGFGGQLAVDLGVAGTQLAGDALVAAMTGGSSLLPMAIRSFGGGAQEARQEGATLGEQVVYGAGSAALSAAAEKLFSVAKPLTKLFGKGFADDFVKKLSGRLAETAAGRAVLSAISEGAEEAIEAVLNPVLKRVTYDEDAKITVDTLAEAGYNALIGAGLGGVLGAAGEVNLPNRTSSNSSQTEAANADNATADTTQNESGAEAIVEPATEQSGDALETVLLDSVSPTARQINEIAKDPAQLERLGIDPNGKTASQLRAEVREALAPKTAAPVAETAAPVQQNVEQTPVQTQPIAAEQEITPQSVNAPVENANESANAGNTVGAAQQGFDPFTALQNQYGTLPSGENPVRSDDMPVSVDGVKKVSQSAVTMKGAAPTTNARVKQLERAVLNGDLSYIPGTNKAQIRTALDTIKYKGWHQALADWTAAVNRGQVSANLVAEGALIYNAASNSYADETEFLEIARTYTELLHNAGQATQAARILKTLTPSGRLYLIESAVKKMNDERDVAWIWMERVGEMLADKLKGAVSAEQKSQVATVTETILDDLYYFAMNETKLGEDLREKRKATRRVKRTDLERFSDLFKNPDKYHAAWDTARNTIIEKFGKDKDVMKALDSWINTFLDEAGAKSLLSKELFGKNAPIEIPDELVGEYLKAETDDARDDVVTQIAAYVAARLPVSFEQKFDAWRHIMMLGNFKTIERNVIGNTGMMGVRAAHNAVAATMERVFGTDRTRSATVSEEWMDAAREYYEQKEVKADAMGDNKYSLKSEKDAFMRLVQEMQKPFGDENGKAAHDAAVNVANKASEIVSWAMNNKYFGDEAFNRHAFARMFAGYLKANGVTVEQFNDQEWRDRNWLLVDKARTFAVKEAKEATFRDDSTLSKILTNLRYTGEQKPLGDAYNIMLRGLQPYINTPANITMRAIEYSPVGLFTSAVSTAQRALSKTDMVWNGGALGKFAKKGMEISGSQLVNEWAKSLTGSAIFVLGMIFRNKGWLRGSSDDDEKQAAFDDLTGVQEYSIEFGDGTSVTFDWFTPTAVPLFAGAEFADAVNEYGVSAKALGQALSSGAEVLLNASVLQGIEDALQQVRYSDDNASLPKIAANAALNYFLQGLSSSLVGQISRAADGESTMTYVDRDSSIPDVIQKSIGSFARKTPFMDTYQVPYIDAWGRTEEQGDFMTRLANNLFNPAFTSKIEVSEVESELQRLYDSVGGDGYTIFPTRAEKSFEVNGKNYHLSAEEYVKYATAKGEYSLKYVKEATNSWMYKNMSDADKAKLLDNLYKYANYKAKREAVPAYDSKTFKNVAAADKAGTSPVVYYAK